MDVGVDQTLPEIEQYREWRLQSLRIAYLMFGFADAKKAKHFTAEAQRVKTQKAKTIRRSKRFKDWIAQK